MPKKSIPLTDDNRLHHMLDAAVEAIAFAAGIDRASLHNHLSWQLSKNEIIGEQQGLGRRRTASEIWGGIMMGDNNNGVVGGEGGGGVEWYNLDSFL